MPGASGQEFWKKSEMQFCSGDTKKAAKTTSRTLFWWVVASLAHWHGIAKISARP
jgi:hypothetical protein